jgi:hypothetical protein
MAGIMTGRIRLGMNRAAFERFLGGLLLVGLFALLAGRALAISPGACVQSFDYGDIDWTGGYVLAEAEGSGPELARSSEKGFALARRQAVIETRRHLLKTVKEVRIQGRETVHDLLQGRSDLDAALRDLIHAKPRVTTQQLPEGRRVRAQMRLELESVARVCFREDVWYASQQGGASPAMGQNGTRNGTRPMPAVKSYTGLIIDARGTSVSPALLFQVFDEQQQPVIGPGLVDPETAESKGVVQFFSELDAVGLEDRVGPDPMRMRVIGAAPGQGGDALISDRDAQRIRAARSSNDFVSSCSVAVVIRSSEDSRVIEYSID